MANGKLSQPSITGREKNKMEPVNPFQYNGSSGSVPRDTSIDREKSERESGATSLRARRTMHLLQLRGNYGLTWKEMQQAYHNYFGEQLHHGQISGVLSNLHRDGRIFTTKTVKRGNCLAYFHSLQRGYFSDDERYDDPVQTKAGIRKAALESLLANIRLLNDHQEELSYGEFTELLAIYLERFDKQTE
jgi:hypothetical protein